MSGLAYKTSKAAPRARVTEKSNAKTKLFDDAAFFLRENPSITLKEIDEKIELADSDEERDYYFRVYNAILRKMQAKILKNDGLVWNDHLGKFISQE